MISVAIISESEFLRLGLRTAVETTEDFKVVKDLAPDASTVMRITELEPVVALMGMVHPPTDTIETCVRIMEGSPSTRIIMIMPTRAEEDILPFMTAGVSGYLLANSSVSDLMKAMRSVANGGIHLDRGFSQRKLDSLQKTNASQTVSRLEALSDRELAILAMIGEGYGNDEMGSELNLATGTIRNNITRIRAKLNIHSRAKLIKFALDLGIRHESGFDHKNRSIPSGNPRT